MQAQRSILTVLLEAKMLPLHPVESEHKAPPQLPPLCSGRGAAGKSSLTVGFLPGTPTVQENIMVFKSFIENRHEVTSLT